MRHILNGQYTKDQEGFRRLIICIPYQQTRLREDMYKFLKYKHFQRIAINKHEWSRLEEAYIQNRAFYNIGIIVLYVIIFVFYNCMRINEKCNDPKFKTFY